MRLPRLAGWLRASCVRPPALEGRSDQNHRMYWSQISVLFVATEDHSPTLLSVDVWEAEAAGREGIETGAGLVLLLVSKVGESMIAFAFVQAPRGCRRATRRWAKSCLTCEILTAERPSGVMAKRRAQNKTPQTMPSVSLPQFGTTAQLAATGQAKVPMFVVVGIAHVVFALVEAWWLCGGEGGWVMLSSAIAS